MKTGNTDLTGRSRQRRENRELQEDKKQEQRRMRCRFAPVFLCGMIRITVSNVLSDFHLHNQIHSDRKH